MAAESATKIDLSGSPGGGRRIKIAATATAGTTVHATGNSDSIVDEINLDLANTSAASVLVTLEWGGTTSPDDHVKINLGPYETRGFTSVLQGTGAAARTVAAFAATANVVTVGGWVDRYTPAS